MVARWGVDVLHLQLRRGLLPYLASAVPRRPAGADYFGADRRRRTRHGARRPLVHHGRGIDAEFRLAARRRRRSADLAGRLRLRAQINPRWEAAALPGAKRGFERIVAGGTP